MRHISAIRRLQRDVTRQSHLRQRCVIQTQCAGMLTAGMDRQLYGVCVAPQENRLRPCVGIGEQHEVGQSLVVHARTFDNHQARRNARFVFGGQHKIDAEHVQQRRVADHVRIAADEAFHQRHRRLHDRERNVLEPPVHWVESEQDQIG